MSEIPEVQSGASAMEEGPRHETARTVELSPESVEAIKRLNAQITAEREALTSNSELTAAFEHALVCYESAKRQWEQDHGAWQTQRLHDARVRLWNAARASHEPSAALPSDQEIDLFITKLRRSSANVAVWRDVTRQWLRDVCGTGVAVPPSPSPWISVNDRLPPDKTECLYVFNGQWWPGHYLGCDNPDSLPCFGGKYGFLTGDVTHWMPIPTLPGAAETKKARNEVGASEAYSDKGALSDQSRERGLPQAEGVLTPSLSHEKSEHGPQCECCACISAELQRMRAHETNASQFEPTGCLCTIIGAGDGDTFVPNPRCPVHR